MNKKAGIPVTVVFLVVATFVLLGYTWYTFLTKEDTTQIQINTKELLEKVYAKESQINFYIKDSVKNAAQNIKAEPNPKAKFIANLKKELEKYKIGENYVPPQLSQIELQAQENKVQISDDKLLINFKIQIKENSEYYEYELASAEYIYEKEFGATIN